MVVLGLQAIVSITYRGAQVKVSVRRRNPRLTPTFRTHPTKVGHRAAATTRPISSFPSPVGSLEGAVRGGCGVKAAVKGRLRRTARQSFHAILPVNVLVIGIPVFQKRPVWYDFEKDKNMSDLR
jgi:hypothetical protein